MRKTFTVLLMGAALTTAGCAAHRRSGVRTPDEFAVARNAPLIIPPDFNLAPPVAGTGGLSANESQQQAIDVLFGGPAPRSLGEMTLLDAAGRNDAQTGIRSQVWDPDTRLVDKGPETVQILAAADGSTNVASATAGR
jgi:hypothetical protein